MTADMTGKVVAITGANSGIGRATARALAGMGATVLACGRSRDKVEEAAGAIAAETGAPVTPLVADLSSLDEVRGLAAAIREHTDRLDVLVNNAGVGTDRRVETADGLELCFAVNHLAPFLLTRELRPLLEATGSARVVTVSSALYASVKALDLDDLQSTARYDWSAVYNRTKLANVLFTRALARRLEGTGVSANCLHPGVVATGFGADGDLQGFNAWSFRVMKWFLRGPEAGARTSVYLASSPEVEGVSGRFFDKGREVPLRGLALDDELAEGLWARSEALVG